LFGYDIELMAAIISAGSVGRNDVGITRTCPRSGTKWADFEFQMARAPIVCLIETWKLFTKHRPPSFYIPFVGDARW
jgi:hypothetical protein